MVIQSHQVSIIREKLKKKQCFMDTQLKEEEELTEDRHEQFQGRGSERKNNDGRSQSQRSNPSGQNDAATTRGRRRLNLILRDIFQDAASVTANTTGHVNVLMRTRIKINIHKERQKS